MDIKKGLKELGNSLSKNAPSILIGVGAAGLLASVVLAVRATPKAEKHIEEKKKELGTDKLGAKEIVKAVWKDYAVTAATVVVSEAAIVTGAVLGEKKCAGLLTMYTISEKALGDYKDVIAEAVTDHKRQEIDAKVAEKHVEEDEKAKPQIYTLPSDNKIWFIESSTGQTFRSDIPSVKSVFAKLNETIAYEMWANINDLLYELGEITSDPLNNTGLDFGWGDRIDYDLVPVTLSGDRGVAMEIQYRIGPLARDLY